MTDAPKTALIIVDHGSRRDDSNRALDDVASEVSLLAGDAYVAVLAAHMDVAAPTIADAFDRAAAAGAEFVIVAQYFLGPGRHSEADVPRLAAAAAARHRGIGFAVTGPLGPDRALSELVLCRAAAALPPRRS